MARKKAEPETPEAPEAPTSTAPATAAPTEEWDDNPEDEHLDDQDQGEDDDPEADLAARSNVDHDASEGVALAPALTDRQQVGLDPVDPAKHQEQAGDRQELTNSQTDHERENALDPVSGTPNPGVVEPVPHSAPGAAGASDMSGNAPMPDPIGGLAGAAKDAMTKLQKSSKEAHGSGKPKGHGWLSLKEIGVSKAVMDSLVKDGKVDQETRPGGRFSPETGTVYRIKGHDKKK